MRAITLVIGLSVASLSHPAMGLQQLAQYSTGAPDQTGNGRMLEDAPVPGPAAMVPPADRVAGAGSRSLDAGPVNATPFSAGPTSPEGSGSQASPNGTPPGETTPALGK